MRHFTGLFFVILIGVIGQPPCWAQGLQYDTTMVKVTSANCNPCNLWTVPNGKVWKIVGGGGRVNNNSQQLFFINGKAVGYWSNYGHGVGQTRLSSLNLPFWLPAGTDFGIDGDGDYVWISVIQFDQ